LVRELDALVAEKVMGRTLKFHSREGFDQIARNGNWSGTYEEFLDNQDYWSPSTDIAAAWEVVDHLTRDRGEGPILEFGLTRDFEHSWEAEFSIRSGGLNALAYSDTAPLAICLAALKAIGVG
jgi:hypothetical protein